MKRIELIKHLKHHGCELLREGGKHSVFINPSQGKAGSVPIKGKADEDSDLDIVALIDEKNPDIVKSLEDTAYQIMWDHDFKPVISLKVFVESEFIDAVNKGFPFYKNVLKEGIVV